MKRVRIYECSQSYRFGRNRMDFESHYVCFLDKGKDLAAYY